MPKRKPGKRNLINLDHSWAPRPNERHAGRPYPVICQIAGERSYEVLTPQLASWLVDRWSAWRAKEGI